MTPDFWNPRGTPTWPDWKTAEPGTRVEHVQSGHQGTFVKASKNPHNGAIIEWDSRGFGPSRGYCVAPAFDLRPVEYPSDW